MIPNGLILPELDRFSFEFRGMTKTKEVLLFPDGSLMNYLPHPESQVGVYFDDYGCVSHSEENCLESLIIKQLDSFSKENQSFLTTKIYHDGKPDFSDRDLVVLSGTTNKGNSSAKVYSTITDKGLISQREGGWDMLNRNPIENTKEKYFAYSRTKEGENIAKEFNRRFEILGEWVGQDKWAEASKYGALQVYVNAWYKRNGKYYNPIGGHNHAVEMVDYQSVKIFDTYDPYVKELESWSDCYYLAFKLNIIERVMEKPIIRNNTLLQLVADSSNPNESKAGLGQFGLFLDGKILTGNSGDVLATFYMRNNGNTLGMTKALISPEWNMFEKKKL